MPIGPKNIFGNGNRKNLLKRLVGEVHIVSRDVQPDPKAKIFALEPLVTLSSRHGVSSTILWKTKLRQHASDHDHSALAREK